MRERVQREEGKTKAMGWKGENGLRLLASQTGRTACGPLNVLKTVCWIRERERERKGRREGLSAWGTSGRSRSWYREQLYSFIFIPVLLPSVSTERGNVNTLI